MLNKENFSSKIKSVPRFTASHLRCTDRCIHSAYACIAVRLQLHSSRNALTGSRLRSMIGLSKCAVGSRQTVTQVIAHFSNTEYIDLPAPDDAPTRSAICRQSATDAMVGNKGYFFYLPPRWIQRQAESATNRC